MDAAIALVEREGVGAVSMRRLAAELGAGTMSLYNHIPNKGALLDAIGERAMADVKRYWLPDASWQEQIRQQARIMREVARQHPQTFLLIATRRLSSDDAVRPVELALVSLEAAGYRGSTAVRMMRAVLSYLVGSLLREVATTPELGGVALTPFVGVSAELFPRVVALADELDRQDHDVEFEFGLDLLIGALEHYPKS